MEQERLLQVYTKSHLSTLIAAFHFQSSLSVLPSLPNFVLQQTLACSLLLLSFPFHLCDHSVA